MLSADYIVSLLLNSVLTVNSLNCESTSVVFASGESKLVTSFNLSITLSLDSTAA